MLDAVSFLRDVRAGEAPQLGRRVVVYGGGNTAMDAARTARRLGAEEALIIYRRDRAHMPAHDFEADEADGRRRQDPLAAHHQGDRPAPRFTVEVMELDEDGRPEPTGEFETLEADALVLALGQDDRQRTSCAGARHRVPGRTARSWSDPDMMTGHPGIFAGGDMVPRERTVTVAVGHGKKAARHIDAWLRGRDLRAPPKHDLATFDKLHLLVYTDAARRRRSALEITERLAGFDGGGRRPRREGGALRGAALPVLRQLLRMRRLLRRLPGARHRQARPGQALPLRLRPLHRLRRLLRAVPVPRHRDDPGAAP